MSTFATVCAGLTCAITAHTLLNTRLLRKPVVPAGSVDEHVVVLITARDEARNIATAVTWACAQQQIANLHIIVLDDGSTDDTLTLASAAAAGDSRVSIIRSTEAPPTGWLGKNWACHRLSEQPVASSADVLVFIDADVVLYPQAVAAAVALLRQSGLAVVCPYPRQVTRTALQTVLQPLLQWSWLATLPLRVAERSARPSLSAGNGQFMVVDAETYRRAGGHASVAGSVLEDIDLVRAIKACGGAGGVVDGTHLAQCEMYEDNPSMVNGYTKSLWAAFGSTLNAMVVAVMLALLFIAPLPLAAWAMMTGNHIETGQWLLCYVAAVVSRLVAARTTGASAASALLHPVAVAMLLWLLGRSIRGHQAGTLKWKGRVLP